MERALYYRAADGSWWEERPREGLLYMLEPGEGWELLDDAVLDLKDFDAAFADITQGRPDALLVIEDALTFQGRKQMIDFAIENHLASSFVGREAVEAGRLMSYGARLSEMYRKAADVVDKIFKGGNPADIPMEQPTRLELYINLKTAHALGLNVPPSLLARADEVIE